MSAQTSQSHTHGGGWPPSDPEGRAVRFTTRDPRPKPQEYEPVLLGEAIRLEPMREAHVDALCQVGLDPAVTRYMPAQLRTPADVAAFVRDALAARAAGTAIPFVTVLREPGSAETVVGTTRFLGIDP
jgi:RimJ/RimL family protein N-acetyltransferase